MMKRSPKMCITDFRVSPITAGTERLPAQYPSIRLELFQLIQNRIITDFGIKHVTIQLETECCDPDESTVTCEVG